MMLPAAIQSRDLVDGAHFASHKGVGDRGSFIYGLVCRGQIRYVGQSVNPLARLASHKHNRNQEPAYLWDEGAVSLVILEVAPASHALDREAAWIGHVVDRGHDLVNVNGMNGDAKIKARGAA